MKDLQNIIDKIGSFESSLFQKDFLLTWEKSNDELKLILELAGLVKMMRDKNISPKVPPVRQITSPLSLIWG